MTSDAMTDKEAERFATCEMCAKPLYDEDECSITTDGCYLCVDCAPMLSEVLTVMDEALEKNLSEEWFDMDEHTLREHRKRIAADIAQNGDRKSVSR